MDFTYSQKEEQQLQQAIWCCRKFNFSAILQIPCEVVTDLCRHHLWFGSWSNISQISVRILNWPNQGRSRHKLPANRHICRGMTLKEHIVSCQLRWCLYHRPPTDNHNNIGAKNFNPFTEDYTGGFRGGGQGTLAPAPAGQLPQF